MGTEETTLWIESWPSKHEDLSLGSHHKIRMLLPASVTSCNPSKHWGVTGQPAPCSLRDLVSKIVDGHFDTMSSWENNSCRLPLGSCDLPNCGFLVIFPVSGVCFLPRSRSSIYTGGYPRTFVQYFTPGCVLPHQTLCSSLSSRLNWVVDDIFP